MFTKLSYGSLVASISLLRLVSCEDRDKSRATGEYIIQSPTDTKLLDNLYIVYDSKTRCPKYAVERLFRGPSVEDESFVDKKRPPFHPEPTINIDAFRVHPKEYQDSTYDRGHMAPNADFMRHKDLKHTSFSMANICPQVPQLNKGFWAKFEAWVRYLLSKEFEEVIVITGPVFAPIFINNQWIHINRTVGTFPRLIAVPTHFFKVIIGRNSSSGTNSTFQAVGAYLVPNVNTIDSKTPLSNFVVRLDQLESIVGHRAWLPYLSDQEQVIVDSVVPEGRDLARQLSAKNMKALASSKDIENPQLTTDPDILYINNVYTPMTVKKKSNKIVTVGKGGSSSSSSVLMHLCECVDCNKPIFGK